MKISPNIMVGQIAQFIGNGDAFRAFPFALIAHAAIAGPDLLIPGVQQLFILEGVGLRHSPEVHFEFADVFCEWHGRGYHRIHQNPFDRRERPLVIQTHFLGGNESSHGNNHLHGHNPNARIIKLLVKTNLGYEFGNARGSASLYESLPANRGILLALPCELLKVFYLRV